VRSVTQLSSATKRSRFSERAYLLWGQSVAPFLKQLGVHCEWAAFLYLSHSAKDRKFVIGHTHIDLDKEDRGK
jgi:hypothetical protein